MLKKIKSLAGRIAVGSTVMLGCGGAFAQTYDTSGVTTALTGVGTAVGVVGAAVLVVVVGTRAYKWIARAL